MLALEDNYVQPMDYKDWLIFVILGSTVLVLWFNQIKNEVQQFWGLKNKLSYLTSLWNWMDSISLTIIFVVTVVTMCMKLSAQPETHIPKEYFDFVNDYVAIPIEWLRIMAAIAACCVLAKIFDWLRLFEETAFYI